MTIGRNKQVLRWRLLLLLALCFMNIVIGQVDVVIDDVPEDIPLSSEDAAMPLDEGANETETTTTEPEEATIQVNDYLETLDNEALRAICEDRGFDVIPRKDGLPLERSDFLEAARRCLSLEDEMNAILAQNPDLAAELEAEIARMHQHKQRLEGEREKLLAEKARLEEQLEQAGVELLEASRTNNAKNLSPVLKKAPEDMTFKEVLIETFSQLYDRVRLDVEFAWKFLGPVLRPLKGALQLLWRYCRPHVMTLWEEAVKRAKQIFGSAKNKVDQVLANRDNPF